MEHIEQAESHASVTGGVSRGLAQGATCQGQALAPADACVGCLAHGGAPCPDNHQTGAIDGTEHFGPNSRVGKAYQPWTPEEDFYLLRLHQDTPFTRKYMSKLLGRSYGSVCSRIRKLTETDNIDCGVCGKPMYACSCDFGV